MRSPAPAALLVFFRTLIAALLLLAAGVANAQTVLTLVNGIGSPNSVAVDSSGNVYVTDAENNTVKKITVTGGCSTDCVITTLGSGVIFGSLSGVAVDSSGNVYVADRGDNMGIAAAVYQIVVTGGCTTNCTVNQLGSGFSAPSGVAVDSSGNVYVADSGNNAVYQIAVTGGCTTDCVVTTLGSGFGTPSGVAVDSSGNVYVADSGNSAVYQIAVTGGCTTNCMVISLDPVGSPTGVVLDSSGNVYVADRGNGTVEKITVTGGCTTNCTVTQLGSGFSAPGGVALDASGNVYVADLGSSAVYKIAVTGGCTTNCTVTQLGSGFWQPQGVAVDSSGNVYVADNWSNAIKKITVTGGCTTDCVVTTLGSGFSVPNGVAVDANGNVYVADTYNMAVKKITVTGGCTTNCTVTTLGSGFFFPRGVAVDSSGNVYVVDTYYYAKKITVTGGCTTNCTVTQQGGAFSQPYGVAVDSSGNIFVADNSDDAIKEILWLPPTVTAVTPTTGAIAGGTSVTITGTHLTGATEVMFGSHSATNYSIVNDSSITVTAPAGSAGPVDVTVTTAVGTSATSASDQFTYIAPPTVTGVSPASGASSGGTSVTITGTHFTGASAVMFGANNATSFTVNSASSISATAPAGTGTVDVTVLTPDGTSATSASDRFTYKSVGTCGSGAGVAHVIKPTANLCAIGSASSVIEGATNWSWTCTGTYSQASCTAPFQPTPGNTNSGAIAVTGANGWTIQSASFVAPPAIAGPVPAGTTFPYGLTSLTLTGGVVGSQATVTITYASPLQANAVYYKYNPNTSTWSVFPNAVISGNTVTLTLTDGGVGDDDSAANGVIVDPGGLGFPPSGASAAVPTLSQWGMILLTFIIMSAGLYQVRRRHG